MTKKLRTGFISCAFALAAMPSLHAQNLSGNWQGTVALNGHDLRIVFRILQGDDGTLRATAYSLDQDAQPIQVSAITRSGSSVKIAIPEIKGSYEGQLNSKGDTISGTFTQVLAGSLVLARATPATEWRIPEPLAPVPPMAADATPEFELSTIRPAGTPEKGLSIHVNPSGLVTTTNSSLLELIKYSYDLSPKQITGGPRWVEEEKFDITAKPEIAGYPSAKQLKVMIRGLLMARFGLASHSEQKELQVYAIRQSKDGARLAEEMNLPAGLPEVSGSGPRGLNVKNATIADFGGLLQALVLDRPVVDQTGLGSKRFNFVVRWTPTALAANAAADAPPDIYTAVQEQLGLKIESAKAAVKVMVIDKVDHPDAN